MSEVWVAGVASIAGGIISGIGANKAAGKEARQTKEMNRDSALYGALTSQFEAEQDYYYKQLERAEKMRGLDQFKQFSTVSQFAPGYQAGAPAVIVPNKPVIPNFNVNHKNYRPPTPAPPQTPGTPIITAPIVPAG